MKKQSFTILIIILSSICYKIKAQPYNAAGLTPPASVGGGWVVNFTTGNDTMYLLSRHFNPYIYYSILKFDGTNWALLDTFSTAASLNNMIYSFQYFQGELYIGGEFLSVRGLPNTVCIFAWNNGVFHEAGGGFTNSNYGTKVFAMTSYQNKLIVVGNFLDGFNDYSLLSWDGISYSNMGAFSFIGGVCEPRWISSLKVYNNELYVCGRFNAINGIQNYYNIATFNGLTNSWASANNLYPDSSNKNPSLEVYNNEIYFLYNLMSNNNTIFTYYLKKWNGTSWTLLEQSQRDSSCSYYGFTSLSKLVS